MAQEVSDWRRRVGGVLRRWPVIAALLLIVVGIVLAVVFRSRPRDVVSASGMIEATEVTLSSRLTARVKTVNVQEGDAVRRDEVLVLLRSAEFQEAVEGARGALGAARAQLNEALAGTRPEVLAQARAQVAQAESALAGAQQALAIARQNYNQSTALRAALDAAQSNLTAAEAAAAKAAEDYRRAQQLFEGGAISASDLDAARANAQSAQAQLSGARLAVEGARQQLASRIAERQALTQAETQYRTSADQLRQARAHLQELVNGARPEVIARLRAQVVQAQAAYSQAETQLSYTVVRAPFDATVITRAVEPGELATPGTPLIALADLRTVWLRVYIEEPVYGRIGLGQPASVTTNSYPGEVFQGTVTEISSRAEFTPREIQTPEQRAKLVFGVKVTLDNPRGQLKPGMPADAEMRLMPLAR